jgi:hypothetical protein
VNESLSARRAPFYARTVIRESCLCFVSGIPTGGASFVAFCNQTRFGGGVYMVRPHLFSGIIRVFAVVDYPCRCQHL